VKLANDLAADRKALNEAVRFDLNDDFGFGIWEVLDDGVGRKGSSSGMG